MTMEVSLALLAFSAPVTAGIIVFRPQKNGNGCKYVTTREFDAHKTDIGDQLGELKNTVRSLDMHVRSRMP